MRSIAYLSFRSLFIYTSCIICVFSVPKKAEHLKLRRNKPTNFTSLTVELALFVDLPLFERYQLQYGYLAEDELWDFAATIIQHIQMLFSEKNLEPPISFNLVEYQILTNETSELDLNLHNADIQDYLPLFCRYQRSLKGSWDHATLLSGHDLVRDKESKYSGFATMNTMCTAYSCSLVEARNFKSAFTLAHEIGHSLGMEHDGVSNTCDQSCCIMSPVISAGQLLWSQCSVAEWHKQLYNLSQTDWYCLELTNSSKRKDISLVDEVLPGQKYSLDDQCSIYFGSCYHHVLKRETQLSDVCKEVWCSQGGSYLNASHSALEGTYCGPSKWCRRGKCVLTNEELPVTNGQWGHWSNSREPNCGTTNCSECQIANQTRIRRQMRSCSNPSTNNGGKYCEGSHYRGIKCSEELCSGMSVKSFADFSCQQMQNQTAKGDKSSELSGEGLQRLDSTHSCVVWCKIKHSTTVFTFFQPFPDGTRCTETGTHACVAGECLEVRADTKTFRKAHSPATDTTKITSATTMTSYNVVITTQQVRSTTDATTLRATQLPTETRPFTPSTILARRRDLAKPSKLGKWSSWGSWTLCTAKCNGGTQTGRRRCGDRSVCHGANTKMRVCNLRKC